MFEVITHKLEEINEKDYRASGINSPESLYEAFADLNPKKTKIIEAVSAGEILNIIDPVENSDTDAVINLARVNDIRDLEEFLEMLNYKLPLKTVFMCHGETTEQRYRRIDKKYPKLIAPPYHVFDFILKRLFPKWGPTRKIFNLLTKGQNKALSLAHILGLFSFYGFQALYLKDIDNLTYFVFEKVKNGHSETKPSCGMIFKTARVGKNRNMINLYKLRTMHPYSECIQQFVYDLNGSGNGDKITDDFRVASWGKFLRKYWIDELPMLINLIKGELKLVGVRPLSQCKFNMYPKELQELRVSSEPGLIPPFYADMPKNFDELLESERKYLLAYKKSPIKTDIQYLGKCFYNIFIRHARSG